MTENKVIIFEKPGFQGLSLELTDSKSDMRVVDFQDAISSLRVIGQPWVAYEDTLFGGNYRIYEEGSYSSIDIDNKISSMKLISANLENPAIKFFEKPDYSGMSVVVKEEAILKYGILTNGGFSWQVLSGAWRMTDGSEDSPNAKVSIAGEQVSLYSKIALKKPVIYLRPLNPGKPNYTVNIQWDKKKVLSERVSQLDELIAMNKSNFVQKFTHTTGRDYTSSIEVQMSFGNETTIEVGATLSLKLVGELSTKLSHTISVQRGTTESTSSTVSTKVSIPVQVPAKTKLKINVMRKDVSYSIPVEIVIERNKVKKTEYATLTCRDGTDVTLSRHDEPIS
ncbi:hypothetical protein FKM82_014409 [Ascaphus truei]